MPTARAATKMMMPPVAAAQNDIAAMVLNTHTPTIASRIAPRPMNTAVSAALFDTILAKNPISFDTTGINFCPISTPVLCRVALSLSCEPANVFE